MHALIINNHTDDFDSINLLCQKSHITYDALPAEVINNNGKLLNPYELVILSGGLWYDSSDYFHQHYQEELNFIRNTKKPLVGICLGMQLIGLAFGGSVTRLEKSHHEKEQIRLTEFGRKMLNMSTSTLSLYENHTMGVTQIPDDFDLLAYSEDCAEIILHNQLPIMGIQSHPEKLSKKDGAIELWESLLHAVLNR